MAVRSVPRSERSQLKWFLKIFLKNRFLESLRVVLEFIFTLNNISRESIAVITAICCCMLSLKILVLAQSRSQ